MEYKLTYFNSTGRAEPIRIIFAVAGAKYEDERITGEQWGKLKANAPMQGLPLLTIKQSGKPDVTVCQSGAIARFLGKKYGLLGANDIEQLFIEEVVDSVADALTALVPLFIEKDDKKKEQLKKDYIEKDVAKLGAYVATRSKEGKDGFLIGSKLSLADIFLFSFVDMTKGLIGETAWDKCSELKKVCEKTKSNDKIAKWLSVRPK